MENVCKPKALSTPETVQKVIGAVTHQQATFQLLETADPAVLNNHLTYVVLASCNDTRSFADRQLMNFVDDLASHHYGVIGDNKLAQRVRKTLEQRSCAVPPPRKTSRRPTRISAWPCCRWWGRPSRSHILFETTARCGARTWRSHDNISFKCVILSPRRPWRTGLLSIPPSLDQQFIHTLSVRANMQLTQVMEKAPEGAYEKPAARRRGP